MHCDAEQELRGEAVGILSRGVKSFGRDFLKLFLILNEQKKNKGHR